jgi:alkanesulfonate monooxygenase SsuD/methylene tetrahydromethanopterin reductase-like flavin-dependent oxidoreductase (luciferase family)
VQDRLPIWIGGAGERRTARIVARHGDGWNLPFVPPEALAAKRDVLTARCAEIGRDPAQIRIGVNVALADDDASFAAQFGPRADAIRAGAIVGTSVEAATDVLGRYVAAGADDVSVALRAPWNPGALERAAAAVARLG